MTLVPKELRCHLTSNGRAKYTYPTLAAAEAQAAKMPTSKAHPYGAYKCPLDTCPGFHIGRR